ncbi:MAG: twin-arginine translocase TatA/TatE family subunit [Armatimonadetes bacterium]|nr:twin-arginine translocase TatA/TatE family subunit [Armatimonadota bacterium]
MPHGPELWIILGVIVLLFGTKKLPELGRSLGQGIKEFKKSSKGILEDEEKTQPSETESAKTD